ncbi:MAG TPA: hypothetical protein VGZ90_09390 [Puia sp.]|jgi:hypothetical protein|nr:hypothetical protein [Puia sp.]
MSIQAYQYSTSSTEPHPSRGLRFFAHFFSILFHPLLISTYILAFLIFLHPSAFEGVDPHTKNLRMLSMLLFTVFFPCLSLFIAWRLKLIRSLSLENRQDRLAGFIVTMFFYFWASYVFRNLPDTPPVAAHFVLGTFLAVCGAWMCTIFYKVSLHAVAMGGLVGFAIIFSRQDVYASGLYLAIPVLIAGIVCSSRLILGAHNRFEMISGFLLGILAQSVAWLI